MIAEEKDFAEAALYKYNQLLSNENRHEEIKDYQQKLQEFGITFAELAKLRPKHSATIENIKEVALIIASHPELANSLMSEKQMPMRGLLPLVNCSRKTINRHRKYIIALALIYIKEYPYLRTFL